LFNSQKASPHIFKMRQSPNVLYNQHKTWKSANKFLKKLKLLVNVKNKNGIFILLIILIRFVARIVAEPLNLFTILYYTNANFVPSKGSGSAPKKRKLRIFYFWRYLEYLFILCIFVT
jgi:hypothetical protein